MQECVKMLDALHANIAVAVVDSGSIWRIKAELVRLAAKVACRVSAIDKDFDRDGVGHSVFAGTISSIVAAGNMPKFFQL